MKEGDADVSIELPEYDLRRLASARDPLAVVEGFRIHVFLRLAAVLGLRVCPQCPRCNAFRMGCQDKFGSNMRPMGGVLGGIVALGGAVEHQGVGTPHFHCEAHIVCAYQYGTLEDIASKIRSGMLDPDAVKRYQSWLHAEDVLDKEEYDKLRPHVDGDRVAATIRS